MPAGFGLQYGCPALVEEFLSGPEVTVGVVGNWQLALAYSA